MEVDKGGGGVVLLWWRVRVWSEERRWRAMRRVFWWRESVWRWWRVREKRVGEERRRVRRWLWWFVAERMEWVRSEKLEGVRVESAAMMVDVVSSSIMGSCACFFGLWLSFSLFFKTVSEVWMFEGMWLFMYVCACDYCHNRRLLVLDFFFFFLD